MVKYFLVQRVCSICLVFGFLIFNRAVIIILFIIFKIGLPPFHFWVIDFLKINNWIVFFYLITIQKISLFILLSYFLFERITIIRISLIRIIISIIRTFFINSLFYILFYSSIIHSSWIVLRIFFSIKVWLIYFLLYSFLLLIIILLIKNHNLFFITQNLFSIKWCVFWVLIGLPPFSIFLIKWRISIFLIKWRLLFFLIILLTSFLRLYIYFKVIYIRALVKLNILSLRFRFYYFLQILILEVLCFYVFIIL
jgi:NADH:ubiquinone oxidoreductase subunit 2 (subunit N)